jgi:hypothetical protein
MKCNLLLIQFILMFITISAQEKISVPYSDIKLNKKFSLLPQNGKLIITQVPEKMADLLKLFYNGGISINGNYDPKTQNKTFILPEEGSDSLFISSQPGKTYGIKWGKKPISAASITYTGIAYWDAVTLYNYFQSCHNQPNKDSLEKILANYISQTDLESKYKGDYTKWMESNPFLRGRFKQAKVILFNKMNEDISGTPGAFQSSISSSFNGIIGGLDVTQYVQGFADFLRDRIKQELTIAYLQKFKDALANNKAIRELLPKTWQTFKSNDIFNLPSMGAIYKDALADDLAHLTEHFQDYIYKNYFHCLSDDQKEAFIISCAMYSFIDQSAKGYHPSDILKNLNQKYSFNDNKLKSTFIIAILDMFSENLKSLDGISWINRADFRLVNPDLIRIFFALLDDKYNPLFTDASILDHRRLEDLLLSIDVQTDRIYGFLILANNIDSKINAFTNLDTNLSQTDKKHRAMDLFIANANTMTDLLKFVLSLNNDEKFATLNIPYVDVAENAATIAIAVHSNNLAKASNGAISLIESVVTSSNDSIWFRRLKEMLIFMTDVVNADSSAKIKAVLEHYAAPVQSYLTIRQSATSVTLGAYPGLYLGTERNRQAALKLGSDYAFGVTAPLGIAINWGSNNSLPACSNSIFLSIIDIGAALSYRWNNDTSDIPSKITLAQIFSPGVHYIHGFRNSPLTLKLGYQYSPELRKIKTDQNVVNNAGVWRLSASLCVDIPVYIFSSKRNNN